MVICCFIYTILRFVMVYESEREQLLYSCSFFFYLFQNMKVEKLALITTEKRGKVKQTSFVLLERVD